MINLFKINNPRIFIARWIIVFRPALFIKLIKSVFIRPIRTRLLFYLMGPYNLYYYPKEIRKNAQNILNNKSNNPKIRGLTWPIGVEIDFFHSVGDKITFNLAGCHFDENLILEFWESDSELNNLDSEVKQATHRFHWLLGQIDKVFDKWKLEKSLNMISNWIDLNNKPNNTIQWNPYNTSERICNWVIFWSLISTNFDVDKDLSEKWSMSIQTNLRHLVSSLEYPASGLINNHLLNNARALYIGGSFISDKSLVELSKIIFKQHLPNMVGDSGYLLESSSHYHFLLTRSIEEVTRVSIWSGDDIFSKWINDYSLKMQNAARRLIPPQILGLNNISRIGDVSPDIPFDWFDPRPEKSEAGWQNIWGKIEPREFQECLNFDDGWSVSNLDSWFVLAYTNSNTDFYPSSHGHNDFGSFCVFFQEMPVIIDIGRFSYDDPQVGKFNGCENSCHNIVRIDSKTLIPSGGGLKTIASQVARNHANFYFNHLEKKMIWNASSNSGVNWSRQLKIDKDNFYICDQFTSESKSSHLAEGFYYLDSETEIDVVNNNQLLLSYNQIKLRLTIEGADLLSCEETDFYPSYGESISTHRLYWKCNFEKSKQITLSINYIIN